MNALAAALAVQACAAGALALVALDIRAHHRVEQLGGVNVWGYRGPVLRQKQPAEVRIAVAGGDLAFGWGLAADQTIVSELRRLVMLDTDQRGRPLHPITGVNIAAQGLRPEEYGSWIERFGYLRPDVVCIVADPRTYRSRRTLPLPDRRSALFARFGYAPILPLVMEEKGSIVRSRLLAVVARAGRAVDHALAPDVHADGAATSSVVSTMAHVDALERSVRAAAVYAAVVLIAPPYDSDMEVGDHRAIAAMMATRFGRDARVRYVDLAETPGLDDDALRLNGFDLSSAGIARAAESVAPPVIALVRPLIG
jgi:hypothetical protein